MFNEIENEKNELKIIAKSIFQGLSTMQIAKKIGYSKTTTTKKIGIIFKKYNAKTRLEFIISALGQVISEFREKSQFYSDENIKLKNKLDKILNSLDRLDFSLSAGQYGEAKNLLTKIKKFINN